MVWRLNISLKLAESNTSLYTRLLWHVVKAPPFGHRILHFSCVINNDSEDLFLLPGIFRPKDVHLRQLAT
jgi:hypothetical protein